MTDIQYGTQAEAIAAEDRYSLEMGFQLPSVIRHTRKWDNVRSYGGKWAVQNPGVFAKALTFEDTFSGSALDAAKWNTNRNPNKDELQWYKAANINVSDGTCKLTAVAETEVHNSLTYNYTSGLIQTQNKFSQLYGYFEASVKVPSGQGLWPAFWLLPQDNSWPPELDIMENLGHQPNKVYMATHYDIGAGHQQSSSSYIGADFSATFHTFGMLWTPNYVRWYVDGVQRFAVTQNVPSKAMYLILNLAVGGNWPGSPDGNTVFPATFEIDYVRAWSIS